MEHSKNNMRISGDIIPRHKVKGNPKLFHFDHYESTTLTITSEEISLVDNCFRLDETNYTDSAMFEVKVNQKDSIARLIRLERPEHAGTA